jgi:nitroreductase
MAPKIDPLAHRKPGHGVDPLFVRRWSRRAMTGEPLPEGALMTLFEAARWAPSSHNTQPWRFRYAPRDTAHWPLFLGFLKENNRLWCARAGVLIALVSRPADDAGAPLPTHAVDAGMALENLLLQGAVMGFVTHALAGIDREAARVGLAVPAAYEVRCMVAVGLPAPADTLPEHLRAREVPSGRLPLADLVGEGPFPA